MTGHTDTSRQQPAIAIDELTTYLDAYKQARAESDRWDEIANQARRVIEAKLGEAQIGTVAGQPRVRWTNVTSTRLDTKLVKQKAPDIYAACTQTSTTRRFTIVDTNQ